MVVQIKQDTTYKHVNINDRKKNIDLTHLLEENERESGRSGSSSTIKLQRPFVCVSVCLSVCTPPFFLLTHDPRIATKFRTHVHVDLGIIRTSKTLTHPTPGGILGGQKIIKSP